MVMVVARHLFRESWFECAIAEFGQSLGVTATGLLLLRAADPEGKTRAISITDGSHNRKDQVPLVGSVAAGSPILAQECIEEYVSFQTGPHPEDYFALKVRGESMLYAGILPDDLVVVRRQPEAHSGEIVVALFEDEATVKTLSKKNGQVWLLPENPDYEPIDGTRAQIIGKVVGLIRRY